ncbi:MAG: UPF0149 family protein [Chlorobium sp.]|nr:MAG: UPF0149 family protein [Chlorobium sp.]
MNSSDPSMQPLSLDELSTLEQFLVSEQTPPDALSSLEMLDGYMTAAAVGPQVFEVDDWYASMWDQEKELTPKFSSPEEATVISELIVRHNNSITVLFEDEPEEYQPLFDRVGYESDEVRKLAVEEWAMGFIIGMELAYDAWRPLFDDEEAAVLSMSIFMLSKVSDDFDHLTDKEIAELTESVAESVICIHSFWHGDGDLSEEEE